MIRPAFDFGFAALVGARLSVVVTVAMVHEEMHQGTGEQEQERPIP
jgi:hypothetical protein